MTHARRGSRLPISAFVLASATIVAVDLWAVTSTGLTRAPTVGAVSMILDFVVVAPIAYYFLIVRNGLARRGSVLLVAALGTVLASLVIPGDATLYVHGSRWLLVAAEVCLLGFAATRAVTALKRAKTSGDDQREFFDHLRDQLRGVLPSKGAADAIASEASLLYYAAFSWGSRPHIPNGARSFTAYATSGVGALVIALLGLSALEIPLLHLVLRRWHPWVAWLFTVLGLYGVLWGIGCYRSIRLRRTLLLNDALLIRVGILGSARIPFDTIERVERARFPFPESHTSGYWRAVVIGDPQVLLYLKTPVVVERLYGLRRTVQLIGIGLDEVAPFEAELGARIAGANGSAID